MLGYPEPFDTKVGSSVSFSWKSTYDKDDGKLVYMHCLWPQGTRLTMKQCSDQRGEGVSVSGLRPGLFYNWKVMVDDGQGATVSSETRKFQVSRK